MRTAKVYYDDVYCGILTELDDHYEFAYDSNYLKSKEARPISLTMPLSNEIYKNNVLFSFFDGLIPEGYLLDLLLDKYKLKYQDRFDLLLKSGLDTIGAVTVKED